MGMYKLAVQLYTVREEMSKDVVATLEQVAALGYEGVEFAGFFDVPQEEMKAHLERLNLCVVGSHTSLEALENQFEEVIAYNRAIGNKYLVCPWSELKDLEGLAILASQIEKLIPKIKAEGMELLYHNHDHELQVVEGSYLLDRLVEACHGELGLEVDTFWVYRAGVNPIEYLRQHQANISLVHIKDGTANGLNALGEGDAPVKDVLEAVDKLGLEWIIVENDDPSPSGIEDIKRSIAYLKAE
ncbi:MAG: sugar phosphate isomerase/epimerase [Niameybacter sp.]